MTVVELGLENKGFRRTVVELGLREIGRGIWKEHAFQVEQVVFVGDRGMIKSVQQQELTEEGLSNLG